MTGSSKPVVLLAGGRDSKRSSDAAIVKRLFSLTGRERPRVAYVGAANDDRPRFLGYVSALLAAAGPCDVELAPLAGRRGSAATARDVVLRSDLVFVGGGDVEVGMRWLQERDFVDCLRQKRAAGAPIVGASAGAIMLALRWVRWRDPDDDSTAELFDCLGLAPVLCDTHSEDDDWTELKALLALSGDGARGWGIRSGAAIEVASDGAVAVLAGTAEAYALRAGRVVRARGPGGGA